MSKSLGNVVYNRTYNFLNENDLLYKNQFGFRLKHSTMHAVTNSVLDILEAMEVRKATLNVYLELSKAFDTIDRWIL